MPIGKQGSMNSPIYKGGSTPPGLPGDAGNIKSGTTGPTGLGSAKNPPSNNIASSKRIGGDLATFGKDLPDSSNSGISTKKTVLD